MKKAAKGKSRIKTDTRARVTDRINRLAGQVKALGVMTERGDDWKSLLPLAAAIEGASDSVTAELYQGRYNTGLDLRRRLFRVVDATLGQIGLGALHAMFAVMKDAGRQHRIGVADQDAVGEHFLF